MQPFQFYDPFHERVHEKLKFIGEGPASFFRDICRMLSGDHELESETHLISHLLREIESAVRDAARTQDEKASGSKSHQKDIKNILKKLEIRLEHPVSETWLQLADSNFEFQFRKLAHRDSFNPPRKRHDQIEEVWEGFLYVIDEVVDKLQGRYFSAIEVIDTILDDQPSTANVQTLAGNIPHNETTLLYLYNQCDDPEWLSFFKGHGFFDYPPAIINTDENTYRYPQWPAAIYLQKVANKKSEEVSKIIKNLPATDNRRVYEDIVRAVQQMPAEISAEHTDLVVKWIKSGSLSHASEPYFDLALHLAKNGYQDHAIRILQAILGPVDTDDIEKGLSTYSPDTRISDWEFKNFLNGKVDEFKDPLQLDFLKLVCGLLNDFLEVGCTKPDDFSYSWKRNLTLEPEESENFVRDPREDLLNLLVRQINHFIQEGTNSVKIVNFLNQYDWHIFKRIKLLLHARDGNLAEVKKVLLDADLFDKYWISREYKSTLREYFPQLKDENQKQLLGWIKKGLSSDTIKKRLKGWNDDPTEEEITAFNRKWQLRKLHPINEYLEGFWKAKYQELVEEFGEPIDKYPYESTTFVGPTSPKSTEELIPLSVEKVVSYLEKWQPEEAYDAPSHEGLGRVMATVVKENAEVYSKKAMAFKELIPTYVRSLISGLRDAVNEGTEIYWEPVLKLSAYAVEQEDDDTTDNPQFNNPEWQWTRKRLADLLGEGCKQTTHPIPFKYREQIWELLEILVEDPQPDLDHEKKYHGGDPIGLSINTVRGEAMHALFYYIRWVRTNLQDNDSISFKQMPEIREVLERHLDTNHDPTLTIRSVYGQHLGTLVETDPEWLNEHLCDIFPEESEQRLYFKAAWHGFIRRHRSHKLFIEHIKSIYQQAIVQLYKDFEVSDNISMADRRLVVHLTSYYWRKQIELNDDLFSKFFKYAPTELRGYVFNCIGRSLKEMVKISPEVLDRSKTYIENRIEQAQSDLEDESYQTELAHFGWCFSTDYFEDDWAIARLHDIVQITPHIEHDRSVIQELTDYVGEYPEVVMFCIERMVKNVDKTMRLHVWKTPLKELLNQLLKENDEVARKAKELVQYISQKSYHLMQEFKPLLE